MYTISLTEFIQCMLDTAVYSVHTCIISKITCNVVQNIYYCIIQYHMSVGRQFVGLVRTPLYRFFTFFLPYPPFSFVGATLNSQWLTVPHVK